MIKHLRPVWAYRSFVLGSVKREFQLKYRNSLLGAAWNIINPLAMILVYTLIFSQVMQAKLPGLGGAYVYSIYLCAGILSWGLFDEIVSRSKNMFLEHANLLKKISFPRLCIPVTITLSASLNFSIVFALFTVFLLLTGNFPGMAYAALVPVLGVVVLIGVGLGMVLGVLNVFFRDVGHFAGIFITFWFWLTPIVYPASILPDEARPLLALNPMAAPIAAVQGIVVQSQWPQWGSLIYPAATALILCALGAHFFRRRAGEMVDEL